LTANISVTSVKQVARDPLGSLGRAACLGNEPEVFSFDYADPSPLELGAHIDLVNELLFSLWYNGGLDLVITSAALEEMGTDVSQYGISDLYVETAPLLPPVVTTCNDDQRLTAQLGDFYVEADFNMLGIPADIHMYLFLVVGADLAVGEGENAGQISIEVHDPEAVLVDLESVNEEWKGKESMLTGLITDTLVPMLMKKLQEEPLSFALPAINLGDLLGGEDGGEPSPLAGKELVIDLQSLVNVVGYVHLEGGILVQDVPPEEPVE